MAAKSKPGRVISTATVQHRWPEVVEMLARLGEVVVTKHGRPVAVIRLLTDEERATYGRAA